MCRTCWRRRCDAQHRRDRADFPGIGTWHYLDSGATAQKPQAVIDATVRAMGVDYATVHRGVYNRSAQMTLAYEAARRTIARFIGGDEHEIVFTRGATEAINLVAASWGAANLKAGDRILLSTLEHHSNIVPWQILREKAGFEIDVCPLTADGQIDLDAAEAMLTPHTSWSRWPMCRMCWAAFWTFSARWLWPIRSVQRS
jgi:cysteine desulfurase/selenocysteine lyase